LSCLETSIARHQGKNSRNSRKQQEEENKGKRNIKRRRRMTETLVLGSLTEKKENRSVFGDATTYARIRQCLREKRRR